MYFEVTKDIEIRVQPSYVAEQSSPEQGLYFFAYNVHIKNLGEKPARLISRHWIITDGDGRVEEVKGPGVVGETPRLIQGGEFEYSSACPLSTPTGNMRGTYQMQTDTGEKFDVVIPVFFLRVAPTFH